MNKTITLYSIVAAIYGYLAAFGSWYVVLQINNYFSPGQYDAVWRMLLWVSAFGTTHAYLFIKIFLGLIRFQSKEGTQL